MSGNGDRAELWDEMLTLDGEEIELVIERRFIEPGRTISADAMSTLIETASTFIGTRIMRRWDETNEPPSAVRVILRVEAR